MTHAATIGVDLFAVDPSGQRKFAVKNFPRSATVQDLVESLVPSLGLSANDSMGRPLNYQAFTRDEHVHLRGTDTVGKAVQDGEEISLLPDVMAG